MANTEVVKHSVHTLVFRSLKRSHDMFISEEGHLVPKDNLALRQKIACKVHDDHYPVKDLPPPSEAVAKVAAKAMPSNTVEYTDWPG